MSKRKFKHGQPKHVVWWLTHVIGNIDELWRWWNGKYFSHPAREGSSSQFAKAQANRKTVWPEHMIMWCDYWPKNARAPRINPNKKG